jgi:hypothetical protein
MTPDELLAMLKEHLEVHVNVEEVVIRGDICDSRYTAVITKVLFNGETVCTHEGEVNLDAEPFVHRRDDY